jgi:outer membrane protein assembly factor BamB
MPPSRRTLLGRLTVAGVLGAAGCTSVRRGSHERPPAAAVGTDWSPPGDEWRLAAADPRRTASSVLSVGADPATAWTREPGEGGDPIAATGGTVFVRDPRPDRPVVRALRAADGAVRWARRLDGRPTPAGLVDGRLTLVVDGTDALALDPADGTTRWRVPLADRVRSRVPARLLPADPADFAAKAVATPETVYVHSAYGLHGLDPADGSERWRVHLPAAERRPLPAGLSVHVDAVVASTRLPGRLATYDGDGVATAAHPGDLEVASAAPTLVDGTAYLTPGGLSATGDLAPVAAGSTWAFPGFGSDGPTQTGRPATDGDRLFCTQLAAGDDGLALHVLALSLGDGTAAWTRRYAVRGTGDLVGPDRLVAGAPAVADGTLLVGYRPTVGDGAPDGRLLALDATDGTERWSHDLEVAPASVAVAGDRVYVGGRTGGFTALDRS